MRERPMSKWTKYELPGITPAYAGKTQVLEKPTCPRQDHPRVCGKDKRHCNRSTTKRGSPPRMRERPMSKWTKYELPGITPAYAGKTQVLEKPTCPRQDHPRVCGKD